MVTISTVARACGCEQYEAFCTTVQVCSRNSVTTNKMTITKPSLLRTNFGADKPNQAGIQCLQKQLAKQQPRCQLCTCSFGVWCPVFLQSKIHDIQPVDTCFENRGSVCWGQNYKIHYITFIHYWNMFHALAMRRLQRGQPKQLPQQAKLQQRPQLIFDFLIYLAISKTCPFGWDCCRWFLSVCGGQLSSFFGLMKHDETSGGHSCSLCRCMASSETNPKSWWS